MLQPEHSGWLAFPTPLPTTACLSSPIPATMNRFYTTRRQRLSLGRFKCEVCGERIRWWAWETPTKTRRTMPAMYV